MRDLIHTYRSILFDHLHRLHDRDTELVLVTFFNYKEQESQTPIAVMGALLRQLVQQSGSNIPACILQFYESHQAAHTKPELHKLISTLKECLASYSRSFVVLDALDECPRHAETLLSLIPSFPNSVQVIITSRHFPLEQFRYPQVLQIESCDSDIRTYVLHELQIRSGFRKILADKDLCERILRGIADRARGM